MQNVPYTDNGFLEIGSRPVTHIEHNSAVDGNYMEHWWAWKFTCIPCGWVKKGISLVCVRLLQNAPIIFFGLWESCYIGQRVCRAERLCVFFRWFKRKIPTETRGRD